MWSVREVVLFYTSLTFYTNEEEIELMAATSMLKEKYYTLTFDTNEEIQLLAATSTYLNFGNFGKEVACYKKVQAKNGNNLAMFLPSGRPPICQWSET